MRIICSSCCIVNFIDVTVMDKLDAPLQSLWGCHCCNNVGWRLMQSVTGKLAPFHADKDLVINYIVFSFNNIYCFNNFSCAICRRECICAPYSSPSDPHFSPPTRGWGLTALGGTVRLRCADTLETHRYNTRPRGIYHSSINTSASSSSPCLPPLINQQTSPQGSTLQLSSLCACVCAYTDIGVFVLLCVHAHK